MRRSSGNLDKFRNSKGQFVRLNNHNNHDEEGVDDEGKPGLIYMESVSNSSDHQQSASSSLESGAGGVEEEKVNESGIRQHQPTTTSGRLKCPAPTCHATRGLV